VPGSPFATGGVGVSFGIAVSPTPDGRFLMVSDSDLFNRSYGITVFSIASHGALTPIVGSPFATQYIPLGIRVGPDGKFLAVALYSNQVQMFSIGPNGFLTSVDVFTAKGSDRTVAGIDIDCSSSFLYAGESTAGIVVHALNMASNGRLSPIAGSPFKPAVGENSSIVLLSPDDKALFVSNQGSNTITAFSVASCGGLSIFAGSPFPMHGLINLPTGMATSEDGTLLYVADLNSFISVFSVTSSGALTEVAGSPFATGQPHGLLSLTAYPQACVQAAAIEIKPPASPPIPINPRAKGKMPVAILSTFTFDAVTQMNTTSLTFGHTGDEASLEFCDGAGKDVNGDGLTDLVCHFNTTRTGFLAGDTIAFLKGQTVAGAKVQGSEGINTVPK